MDVAFAYSPGDRVTTELGENGVVDSCVYSKAGIAYYVIVGNGRRICIRRISSSPSRRPNDKRSMVLQERRMQVEVTYLYSIDARVKTALGDEGIIYSCAFGRDGISYYVNLAGGDHGWFYEDQLEAI